MDTEGAAVDTDDPLDVAPASSYTGFRLRTDNVSARALVVEPVVDEQHIGGSVARVVV